MISKIFSIIIVISVIVLTVLGTVLVHDIQSTKGLNSQDKDFGSGSMKDGKIVLNIINASENQGDNIHD